MSDDVIDEFGDVNVANPAMLEWALGVMDDRQPDFVIGKNYLRRWHIVPRNELRNVYLHEFRRSDDDRAFHDHPWNNMTIVLRGSYIEHTPDGSFVRKAGDVVRRPADSLHRIELPEAGPGEAPNWPITLFTTGPKVREWGFACPQGWRHWSEFYAGEHGELVGAGCD